MKVEQWVRGYAQTGQKPVLQQCSKRYSLTEVSAISNQGLVCFEFLKASANTQRVDDLVPKSSTRRPFRRRATLMSTLIEIQKPS
ncbi:hypothetical protein MIZ03_2238 [Rhodoferax lithotrophicus]|uniref:Uncharacterized protein n=1 Tax=Rhodoferax lithotrophicus TaxID=2798804 RepID=A0ABM7MM84_9BURK|nr:hypothetical protein MIZ03_2238 [Rhodoferax sp. MIZ03]